MVPDAPSPLIGLLGHHAASTGLIDHRAFGMRVWSNAARQIGGIPVRLTLRRADELAALWNCAAVVHLGGEVYPELQGALVASCVAAWVRDGGIWVEIAGWSFLFGRVRARRGQLEPRSAVATDLFDLLIDCAVCGDSALTLTATGRHILGDVYWPSSLMAANAGSPRRLALFPSAFPTLSLVETDDGHSVLSVNQLGAGSIVRWAAAARVPVRHVLPAALLKTVAFLRLRQHESGVGSRSPGLRLIVDPQLRTAPAGVAVGVAVLNPGTDCVAVPAVHIELRGEDGAARACLPPAHLAAGSVQLGEAVLAFHGAGVVDISARLGGDGRETVVVGEPVPAPKHFPRHMPAPQRPRDFAAFWQTVQDELRAVPSEAEWAALPEGSDGGVITERVWFRSLGGVRIGGFFCRPARRQEAVPGVVVFPGYGGMDELPERLARCGLAALFIDVRGVGYSAADYRSRSEGLLTDNLAAPDRHGFRGAIADCLRAVDVLSARLDVDPERIGALGISQGGGLCLAVGSLDTRVRAVVAESPFLCDIYRSAAMVDTEPLAEVRRWLGAYPSLNQTARQTLDYFDVANFVQDLRCPTLLMYSNNDEIGPVEGLHTVIRRMQCPLTLQRYYAGHRAPALLSVQARANDWMCRTLTSLGTR